MASRPYHAFDPYLETRPQLSESDGDFFDCITNNFKTRLQSSLEIIQPVRVNVGSEFTEKFQLGRGGGSKVSVQSTGAKPQRPAYRFSLDIFGETKIGNYNEIDLLDPTTMIVVSNRVTVENDHVDTFVKRLRQSHGIEDYSGFRGLKLLGPKEAETHITMTFWDTLDDYKAWRESEAFDKAHPDRSAEEVFQESNDVEIHEVILERNP